VAVRDENGPAGRVEIDPRVGGSFTVVERRDGEDVEHIGEYLEIDRPRRLVFAFRVPKYSQVTTRVSVDIVPLESGCQLTLTHEGLHPDYVSGAKSGWGAVLLGLAETLA
jgi:uncharacterized protein YndB with AHSA1/START domain